MLWFHPFSAINQWCSDHSLLIESNWSNLSVATLCNEVLEIAEGGSHDSCHVVVISS